MLILTEDAKLVCAHQLGKVKNEPSQDWVRIDGRRVLVRPDPVGRGIVGCPNLGIGIVPCRTTLKVKGGYSAWIFIGGEAACTDGVRGLTDGTPPGLVEYLVNEAGQSLVTTSA